MGRGLYGQNEGNETRGTAAFADHCSENAKAYAEPVRHLKSLLAAGKFADYDAYVKELPSHGWDARAVQNIVTASSFDWERRGRGKRH